MSARQALLAQRLASRSGLAHVGANPISSAASSAADTGTTIVYILGVGFLVYIGLSYVVPLFFGAASKTKRAKHEYSKIGREDSGHREEPSYRGARQSSAMDHYEPAYVSNAYGGDRLGRGRTIDVDFID